MIKSGDALGVSLARADAALDRNVPGMARLSRSYIDGYSQADKFRRILDQVGNAMDKGMDVDRAVVMLSNIENRFGRIADAAEYAKAGMGGLAAALDTVHFDQSGVNRLLGVNTGSGGSAAASAAAFEEAAVNQERLAKAAQQLKNEIAPVGTALERVTADLALYKEMADAGLITTDQLGQAQSLANQRFQQSFNILERGSGRMKLSTFELANLHYQLSDIAVSLAAGQNPFTVMMQQGSQIGQIFETSGAKVSDVFKSIGNGIVTYVANPVNLAILGVGALSAAAIYGYEKWKSAGVDIEKLLEEERTSLADLTNLAKNLGDQVVSLSGRGGAVSMFTALFDIQKSKTSLQSQLDQILSEIRPSDAISRSVDFDAGNVFGLITSYNTDVKFRPFLTVIREMQLEMKTGAIDAQGLQEMIARVDPRNMDRDFLEAGKTLLDTTAKMAEMSRQAEALQNALGALEGRGDLFKQSFSQLLGNEPQLKPLYSFVPDNTTARSNIEQATMQARRLAIGDAAENRTDPTNALAMVEQARAAALKAVNDELAKQTRLQQLDLAAITARSPAEKAAIAAQRERINALNTSADAQTTDMKAKMAAKIVYEQQVYALQEAARTRLQTANDNVKSAELEVSLVDKSNAQRQLATSNLQAYFELQKEAAQNGVSFDEAQYQRLVKRNSLQSKFVEDLAAANVFYDLGNQRRYSNENPLARDIDQKLTSSGITAGTAGFERYRKALEDAQDEQRTWAYGAKTGIWDVANAAGDFASTVHDDITGAFDQASSLVTNFVKTGKLDFADFSDFAISQLVKLSIQFAESGIFGALKGAGGGGSWGLASLVASLFSANGHAFAGGNVIPFARGGSFTNGIYSRPTPFAYGGGFGVMGEAGPEAVMPLTRGSDGKLGVAASGGGGTTVLKPSITYIGQQRPDIDVQTDQYGQMHVIIQEIARQESMKTMDKMLPAKYGIKPMRTMRG